MNYGLLFAVQRERDRGSLRWFRTPGARPPLICAPRILTLSARKLDLMITRIHNTPFPSDRKRWAERKSAPKKPSASAPSVNRKEIAS